MTDHAGVLAAAREAGRTAGCAHREHGIIPDERPSVTSGPLLMRKAAAEWYRGFENGRQGSGPGVELSALTPVLAVTPAPAGKPGGPGLWNVKGMELPPYFQNIRNALIRSGRSPADAYRITWGAIRRWAAGGGNVHPEVRAAAAKALADLAAKSAIAHSHANEDASVIELVGPKGFVHGWIFVGVPDAGARVLHPQLGAGTVTGHDGKHATVRFDRGAVTKSFEARAGKAGEEAKLAPRADAGPGNGIKAGDHVRVTRGYGTRQEGHAVRVTDSGIDVRRPDGSIYPLKHGYAERTGQPGVEVPGAKPSWDRSKIKAGDMVTAGLRQGHVTRLGRRHGIDVALVTTEVSESENRYGGVGYAPHWIPLTDLRPPAAASKVNASPLADVPKSPFTIIRKQSGKGWAVREEGQPGWVHSSPTRQGAQDYADRVVKQRAALAASEAEGNARTAALLKSRGIGPVDYRNLQPGDQFTWDPEIPPKTVLRVQHLASGASLITWEKDAHTPKGENQTLMTPGHKAYGRLSGHSHAGDVPAIDLAGVFTEALHPRAGGRFASKGGGKVTAARQRHGAKAPAVQRPQAAGPGQTRAQQLRYQAAQDRHIAQQIMVKVAGLVRARDAAIAGLPAPAGKTASATSAAAKATAAASSRTRAKSAAAKAAAKFAAGKTPVSRVAKLDGQIRLLRRDARLLIQAADHLDQQASGL